MQLIQIIYLKDHELSGEPIAKREDQADFSSFKNAFSIVTRRFKIAGPIKKFSIS
jgi:hypothetical protein